MCWSISHYSVIRWVVAIKLWEVTATTAQQKYSEAEKPGENWHFIADFVYLLSAPSVPVVASEIFVTLCLRLHAISR